MDIQPPIVGTDGGDLWFYGSVEEAERDLEPTDVRAGSYQLFDSSGRPLDLTTEKVDKPSKVFGHVDLEVVRVRPRAGAEIAGETLRARIVAYCATLPNPVRVPTTTSVQQLVEWAYEHCR